MELSEDQLDESGVSGDREAVLKLKAQLAEREEQFAAAWDSFQEEAATALAAFQEQVDALKQELTTCQEKLSKEKKGGGGKKRSKKQRSKESKRRKKTKRRRKSKRR